MYNTDFLRRYSDCDSAEAWLSEHILNKNEPPVSFSANGTSSHEMNWEKNVGKTVTVTDYEKTATPVKRSYFIVEYTEKTYGLKVELKVTSYPLFPAVEYSAVLTNISESNSPEIKDLMAIDHPIIECKNSVLLHSFRGGFYSPDAYTPMEKVLRAGDSSHFQGTTGRCTEEYMNNFNVEDKEAGKGVVAVTSWPGKWKTDFSVKDGEVRLSSGEFLTDFVLFSGESFRTPVIVLMFYKGEHADAQNMYRRWLYTHNIMRNQGVREGVRALLCIIDSYPQVKGNGVDDVFNIKKLKETGLTEVIDDFCQDTGWYPCDDWTHTGNWYPDPDRYPDGMGVVGEAAHEAGLQYHVWFEPERLRAWNRSTVDLRNAIIGIYNGDDGRPHFKPSRELRQHDTALINYAIPEAVDYTIEWVNKLLDEGKIDIYRQDYNIQPAPFWDAYDEHITKELGIPRWGITEEKYTAGMLRFWQSIIERHPGMPIDNCAGGGMRLDLEICRYSFPHTRTDWWFNLENSQDHTYGAAQCLVLMGGACPQNAAIAGSEVYDKYQWRTQTTTSTGYGFNFINNISQKSIDGMLESGRAWRRFANYLFYDFYPLTPYNKSLDAVIAFEYDSPEKGEGMIVSYLRPEAEGEFTVYPTHLCEDAKYLVHDEDSAVPDYEISGKDFMEKGLCFKAEKKAVAPLFTYKKI